MTTEAAMKKIWLILILLLNTAPAFATETVDGNVEEDDPAILEPVLREEHVIENKFSQPEAKPFHLIGARIPPGGRKTLKWFSVQSPGGFSVPTPVIVVNGARPGPVLCLTAAIHGDELNGIEITRRIMHGLNPEKLKGTIVGVPIVNLEGFWRRERYIGDRRDLNRYFPGSPDGSYPGRVAYALFNDIIMHCDAVVDIHTGSFFRENLPQLRVDLTISQVAEMAKKFGAITVLQSIGPQGSLRGAATAAGIPAVVMEIGGPLSVEPEKVKLGVKSIRTLLNSLGMIDKISIWSKPQPVFYSSKWLRSETGGILMNKVGLGKKVGKGDILAEIIDPVSNTTYQVVSPFSGTILGRAQNQFVSPGFALFRIGIQQSIETLEEQGEAEKKAVVERQAEQLGIEKEAASDAKRTDKEASER